jgi:lysine 2,3-aminomutase
MSEPEVEAFWRSAPPYRDVTEATFLDRRWQHDSTIVGGRQLADLLEAHGYSALAAEAISSIRANPMAIRLTPVVLASMDWSDLSTCSLRRQLVPLDSERFDDHPKSDFDSLDEIGQRTHPRLVSRYPGRILLLALDTCPIYCAFCTRSYMVGPATDIRDRVWLAPLTRGSLTSAVEAIAADRSITDVLISGGDVANLGAERLADLLKQIEGLPQLRRVRLGTRGFLANPVVLAPGRGWFEAIAATSERLQARGVEFAVHVHFNCAAELNPLSSAVLNHYSRLGTVRLRNQSVCMDGVNSSSAQMLNLIDGLIARRIDPYYVYQHDLIPGCEHLRTTIAETCELEIVCRGRVAGCDLPDFIIDLPEGGGKRSVHSYESYDKVAGIARYRSPVISPERIYEYFDPIRPGIPVESAAPR